MNTRIARAGACGIIVAGLCSLAGCGPERYQNKKSGSEATMQRVQQGQPMYQPPPGSGVPAAGQGGMPSQGMPSGPMGSYNMNPPTR